eukprot:PRCOL_00003416-RA
MRGSLRGAGVDEEGEEDEGDEGDGRDGWGARGGAYYGADAAADEEDEEALGEEAAEELRTCLEEVRSKAEPLLAAVRAGEYATAEGLSYLEAKHMLLLSYCSNIAFYVLLRAEGKSVRRHPVVERLVKLRLYLEKARPIDRKLQYLVDKLLAAGAAQLAAGGGDDGEDAGVEDDDALLAPRPDRMGDGRAGGRGASGLERLLDGDADALAGGGGEGDDVYRPPKMRAMSMAGEGLDEDEDERGERRGRRGRRTGRNEELRDVVGHVGDGPEELAEREDRGWALRERRRAERRAAAEEELFVRHNLTKKERLARAAGERQGRMRSALSEFADLGSGALGDTVAGMAEDMDAMRADGKRRRLSDAVAAAGARARAVAASARASAKSGDADAGVNRPSLGERRSQMDRSRPPVSHGDDGDDGMPGTYIPDMDDVETYARAAGAARKRKADRADAYDTANLRAQQYALDSKDEAFAEEGGRRALTRTMAKNKGLTPHRKKLARNPRAMAREKFRKASVRMSGRGPSAAGGGGAGYGGEGTGIKTNTVRSRKFK